MYNEYHSATNRVLSNYGASLAVFACLNVSRIEHADRTKKNRIERTYKVQCDCSSSIPSFDSQICLWNHSSSHISSHCSVQRYFSIRWILNERIDINPKTISEQVPLNLLNLASSLTVVHSAADQRRAQYRCFDRILLTSEGIEFFLFGCLVLRFHVMIGQMIS